jgi:LemA protein
MKRPITIVLAATLLTGCGYNTIQKLDEQVNTAQNNIEAQLQRRADLIPNLVNTVKGYAQHEEAVLTEVTRARAGLSGAIQSHDPEQISAAEGQMNSALGRLMVVVENYPQLKADQGFLKLQDELTGTENRITVARTDYNDAVQQYNTTIRTFPTALTAKVTGAKPRKGFAVTNPASREAPTVDFSRPAPGAGAPTPGTPPAKTP